MLKVSNPGGAGLRHHALVVGADHRRLLAGEDRAVITPEHLRGCGAGDARRLAVDFGYRGKRAAGAHGNCPVWEPVLVHRKETAMKLDIVQLIVVLMGLVVGSEPFAQMGTPPPSGPQAAQPVSPNPARPVAPPQIQMPSQPAPASPVQGQ